MRTLGSSDLSVFPLFRLVGERELDLVRRMLAVELNTSRAHGMGRLFDGVGALVLARPRAAYEQSDRRSEELAEALRDRRGGRASSSAAKAGTRHRQAGREEGRDRGAENQRTQIDSTAHAIGSSRSISSWRR